MASSVTKAVAVSAYANLWNKLYNCPLCNHSTEVQQLIQSLTTDMRTLLNGINTDGAYTISFTEPRYTIVPYNSGRVFKVRAGQALSYTMVKSGGETTSAAVWSETFTPSWISLDPVTGALSGTAPGLTKATFNISTGASVADLYEVLTGNISCKNDFGEAVNGPMSFNIQIVHPNTSVVSSAGTGGGVHAGALTTYTVTANNTPTSFKAYGLEQLNAGTGGTVAINANTGAITGNCGNATIAGPVTIYVCAVNAFGEGEDKAVVITLT